MYLVNNRITDKFNIIGQENVLKYVNKRLSTGNMPNIILLTGPQGVGKTTIAKYIALSLDDMHNTISDIDINCVLANSSTESIKLFNMSTLTSEEEIKKVNVSFTKPLSGKKILILDECHGMTSAQQDSLLVELEHLHKDIYVIMCTTDVMRLRKALMSRVLLKLRLSKLNRVQLRQLCEKRVKEYNISFSGNYREFISSLCIYANGDARSLDNILIELDNLNKNNISIDKELLDTLIGTTSVINVIMLLHYLETNVAQGLQAIDDMTIDSNFRVNCARTISILNGTQEFTNKDEQELIESLQKRTFDFYCDFLSEILYDTSLDKEKLIGIFYRYNTQMNKYILPTLDTSVELLKEAEKKIDNKVMKNIVEFSPEIQREGKVNKEEYIGNKKSIIDFNYLEEVEDDSTES